MSDRIILHCDLNNFYASVEMISDPSLRDKAVAVCGDPAARHGIVLAKSIKAKAAGVKTGDTVWLAQKKCPGLIVVCPHYAKYVEYSKIVREIYTEFTSEVEPFGLDECWLDVTGSTKLFGNGEEIACKIKERVKERTGGLTVSIGVSFTKVFAKLGSDMKKPDAITVISRENYKSVVYPLPVAAMLFVGSATSDKLAKLNIRTIGGLAECDPRVLIEKFGKVGEKLSLYARGADGETVKCYTEKHIPESVGNGTTTSQDMTNAEEVESVIYALSEMIAFRLRQYGLAGKGVAVSARNSALITESKQCTLPYATSSADVISREAGKLFNKFYDFSSKLPVRTLTVSVFRLTEADEDGQISMFDCERAKEKTLGSAIDRLREKYGYNILKRAVNMDTVFTCDSQEADDGFTPFNKEY